MASQSRTASSGPFTCMASNLPFGSGGSGRSSSKAHLPHVSLLSQPGTRPGIRPVIRERPPGEAVISSRLPAAFRLPAFASWASCSRQGLRLPLRSAYRCPLHRTLTGFPCSARVRHGWGRMSSIPRGRRCPHGRECSTTAACRIATALSLSPRHCVPARRVMLTRHHQGFPDSHPIPSLPLACGPWTGQGPLGFPMSSAPGRYRPRTSWRGQVLDTDPKSRHRHQPASIQRTHSPRATSCRNTPHVRPHVAGISHTSGQCHPHHLAPFALRTAFPSSLAGRYSRDYYGACVTMGLASIR